MRGLKYDGDGVKSDGTEVAPLAGAWIEIQTFCPSGEILKVAPLAGAWIEIDITTDFLIDYAVAPLAGAWIEIRRIGRR